MSRLNSSLHENENYVKRNLVFVLLFCFISLGASVDRMSHLSATTELEFLLKYTAEVDCPFFSQYFFLLVSDCSFSTVFLSLCVDINIPV